MSCQRFGVTERSLFGPAIRGGMRPESDVDVLVAFDPAARVVFVAGGGGKSNGDGMMRFDEGEGGAGGDSAS